MYAGCRWCRWYRRENMSSASAKNNMEFMNNIGAYRLAAKKTNENLCWGGGEKLKEKHNKETKE